MHLIIDGYNGDVQRMQDADFIQKLLDVYPSKIGMTKITTPKVSSYDGPEADEHCVSGFVGLAESHISIHTFPGQDYVNIDIFSCREFDAEEAVRDLQKIFGLTEVRSYVINRPNLR